MTEPTATLYSATMAAITGVDERALQAAEEYQLRLTKPAGALGGLEVLGNRLAGIYGICPPPEPSPALACVFAADHGIQAHGVSPWPQEVTVQMAANIASGGAAVNVLARHAGADVLVYDLGVVTPLTVGGAVRGARIAAGTADMSVGPAMTAAQCRQAIEVGIQAARDGVADGYRCLVPGEVGIGNTTASAALVSVFTRLPADLVTGAGAGVEGELLARKKALVARAIEVNGASADDPLAALAAVGGFEHAAIVGFLLGAAALRVPVVLDGVIVCSAALVAVALCPAVRDFLIAGHDGAEPGIRAALDELGLDPVLGLGLRLGEGSGALAALPLVSASAKILREMATFASAGVTEKS